MLLLFFNFFHCFKLYHYCYCGTHIYQDMFHIVFYFIYCLFHFTVIQMTYVSSPMEAEWYKAWCDKIWAAHNTYIHQDILRGSIPVAFMLLIACATESILKNIQECDLIRAMCRGVTWPYCGLVHASPGFKALCHYRHCQPSKCCPLVITDEIRLALRCSQHNLAL